MKLENNNINISISKQMMEVVENVFTLTVRVLTQTAEFFRKKTLLKIYPDFLKLSRYFFKIFHTFRKNLCSKLKI